MKSLLLLSLLAALPLAGQCCDKAPAAPQKTFSVLPQEESPRITDTVGRAGIVASRIAFKGNAHLIMAIGGANFPHAKPGAKTPAERGAKVFYDEIEILWSGKNRFRSQVVGKLPYPIGYAAHTTSGYSSANGAITPSMIIAGGCNMEGHLSTVTQVVWDHGQFALHTLPSLPVTVAYPAFIQVKNLLYIFGGQEKADSTVCLNRCFVMDINNPQQGWKELAPMPGEGRMLATAGKWQNNKIYVAGGCSLHPDAKGNAERTYLKSTLCYDTESNSWSTVADMPETIVAPATPMPTTKNGLYVICGDPGNFYRASLAGQAPAEHPGQNTAIYNYNPTTNTWSLVGHNCIGIATAPTVQRGNRVYVISGETHPGVRTPVISTITIK